MYHPTTRLLTILEILQSKSFVSGPELAQKLEVDVRSIRRYITMLRDMGIPIESEVGRFGNYYLRAGFRLPPLMFTNDEISAVMLGLLAMQQLKISMVDNAIAKIERVLPDNLREQTRALQTALTFNMPVSQTSANNNNIILTMSLATYYHQRVWFEYQDTSKHKTTREFDCYGVVYHAGLWYGVGYCHLREDLRIFRLDRVERVKLLDNHFTPPIKFDALDYLITKMATLPYMWLVKVLLNTTIQNLAHIPKTIGIFETVDDGILFTMQAENLEWAARFLVSLGCEITIIQPPELRDEFTQLARTLLNMVGESSASE
ncbi:MAG: YafY family transcriptional regulator [Anaerolineae bacterium]|nr:YafY family transcriptional regulator [Anaerolineae bacterium]